MFLSTATIVNILYGYAAESWRSVPVAIMDLCEGVGKDFGMRI